MIDRYQLSHYRVVAERDFLKFGATEFQGWFGRIMAAAFASDYINVRVSKGVMPPQACHMQSPAKLQGLR